jgi:hypothetical protein
MQHTFAKARSARGARFAGKETHARLFSTSLGCAAVLAALLGCDSETGTSGGEGGASGTAGGSGAGGAAGATTGGAAGSAVGRSGSGGGGGMAAAGSGGSPAGQGGRSGTTGTSGTSGAGAAGSAGVEPDGGSGGAAGEPPDELEPFSFFMASLEAMQRLSGSEDGFGGDLRYGEEDGLTGADKICTEIADFSMPGAGAKGWRAFLSVAQGPDGERVDAIDRVGDGPWYDRVGRIVAMDTVALANTRPQGADPLILNDLPNEYGVPNHRPDPNQPAVDNHHTLTGSDTTGRLYMGDDRGTCSDWTSTEQSAGRPRIGFSWIAGNRTHWISGQDEGGCGAGVNLVDGGGSDPSNPIVGSGGGYGAIYCFALMP